VAKIEKFINGGLFYRYKMTNKLKRRVIKYKVKNSGEGKEHPLTFPIFALTGALFLTTAVIYVNKLMNHDPELVVLQEKDHYPIPRSLKENKRFSEIEDQHLKTASNLVSIVCGYGGRGTGVLINPYQIVTAYHVMDNCKNYELRDPVTGDTTKMIADILLSDTKADLTVINLKHSMLEAYSLAFAEGEIKPGRKVALVALDYSVNPVGIYYERGEITEVGTKDNIQKFRTNVPVIHGTSGGIWVDEETNEVIGFNTELYLGSFNYAYNGPTVDRIKVVKRDRELTSAEKKIKQERDKKDLEKVMVTYDNYQAEQKQSTLKEEEDEAIKIRIIYEAMKETVERKIK